MNKNPATVMNATPSNETKSVTRRDFLTLAWKSILGITGLLGLGGLFRFLSYQTEPSPPTAFDLGPADAYPPGIRAEVPAARAVVIHGAEGLQAFSLVCPHLGCLVEPVEAGYDCPCHGSRFGSDGQVLQGPAAQPLQPLKLIVSEEGHLILDIRTPV